MPEEKTVSIPEKILYLSQSDIMRVGLSMEEIIRIVEHVLGEKARGNVEMPPKPGIHPVKDAFIHAMPAYVPALKAAAVKWVSGYPENPARGLPYIAGLLMLNELWVVILLTLILKIGRASCRERV